MTILLKGCIPDNFESSNFLKFSFKNIWGLHAKFGYCESFLESNSPDILTLCETHLDGSINSGNFCVRGWLSFINLKGLSYSYDSLAVNVMEGLPSARDLSPERSADS